MDKKKFLSRMDEDIFKDIKKKSKESGLSMNKLFNLKLKGLEIKKKNE